MTPSRAAVYLVLLCVTAVVAVYAQVAGGTKARAAAAQQVTEASPKAKVVMKPVDKLAVKGVILGQQRRQSFERARILAGTKGTVAMPQDLLTQCSNVMGQHHSDAAQSATPGFGTQAGHSGPFVEERFADSFVIYRFSGGSAITPPNAAPYYCPYMVAMMEVPRADPPAIPSDDSPQANWARYHNAQLQDVIRRLVHDEATMQRIDQAALAATNGDLFKTTDFLTGVADFYAGNVP